MGGFGIWHWIIILVVLGIPAAIIWLAVRRSGRTSPLARSAAPPDLAAHPSSKASRLQELASLRSKGIISEAEYEQQRANILGSV